MIHIDNMKKDTLILGKGPADDLKDITLTTEKEYFISFIEQHKEFCLSCLHHNGVNSYKFVESIEIYNSFEVYKFKAKYSNINKAPLCLTNISKDFSVDKMKKTGLYV